MFQGAQTLAFDGAAGDEVRFESLSPNVMEMLPGERIELNIGAGYTAELDRIDEQALGARTWIGRLEGGDLTDRVIISELNGIAFGRIATHDGVWNIVPDANGGHRVFRHPDNATRAYGSDDQVLPSAPALVSAYEATAIPASNIDSGQAVPVGSNGTLDIAVVYTQSMVDTWGLAVGGRVQYLIALLDQALVESDTGMRARLVHLSQVTGVEAASNTATIYDLEDGVVNGIASDNQPQGAGQDFSSLQAVRDAVGADLVVLVRRHFSPSGTVSRPGGTCGAAFISGSGNGSIGPADAGMGLSVVSDFIDGNDTNLTDGYSFCSDLSFAQEVGHNLGFAHNRENIGASGVFDYANGYRVDCEFITIMAQGSEQSPGVNCPGAGRHEVQVPYFSNPGINLCTNGAPCGVDSNSANSADNALAARNAGLNVNNFRAEVPRIRSSILPISRSVRNGQTATAFATLINPASSNTTAQGCGLRLAGSDASSFTFQTTDASNELTGTANTPVDIPAGGSQNFVFAVTSATTFVNDSNQVGFTVPSINDETELFIEAYCANRRSDEYVRGLNSLSFTSSPSPVADVIALVATVNNDGWIDIPATGNPVGIASVAVSNVGQGVIISASADTGGRSFGIERIELCGTDAQGNCLTARDDTINAILQTNGVATFAIFVRGNGQAIEANPATNRIFIRFREGNALRGATSVAVRTQ